MTGMQRTERLSPSLNDTMAYLLPTESPERWPGAVLHAAQLLAPGWGAPHGVTDLRALAMVLYTLAEERRQHASDVPLDAVREAFTTPGAGEEPRALSDRVTAVVESSGMYTVLRGYSPLGAVWRDLTYQWEPEDPMADTEPAPSALRHAVTRLSKELAALNEAAVPLLPQVPAPVEPLTIPVSGRVRIVSPNASLPTRCGTCGAYEGGSLLLDGPQVLYVCPQGHGTEDRKLEAARVRYAVRYQALPGDEEDLENEELMEWVLRGPLQDALRVLGVEADEPSTVQGDLLVASKSQPVNVDPRRLSPIDQPFRGWR